MPSIFAASLRHQRVFSSASAIPSISASSFKPRTSALQTLFARRRGSSRGSSLPRGGHLHEFTQAAFIVSRVRTSSRNSTARANCPAKDSSPPHPANVSTDLKASSRISPYCSRKWRNSKGISTSRSRRDGTGIEARLTGSIGLHGIDPFHCFLHVNVGAASTRTSVSMVPTARP